MNVPVIFYNLPKVDIELFYYTAGPIDFKSNVPAVSSKVINLKAVELPLQVSKEYLRNRSEVKYEKNFLFKYSASGFERDIVKPNFYINLVNKKLDKRDRYNVKDCVMVHKGYFFATCIAFQGEKVR